MSRCVCRLIAAVGLAVIPLPSAGSQPPAPSSAKEDLPSGAVVRFGTARLRHGAVIRSIAFAPDGKTFASADEAGGVRLWEMASVRQRLELPGGTGSLVRFGPDGKYLVCAGSVGGLCLRDAVTGKLIRRFGDGGTMRGGRPEGHAFIALTPDGQTLAEAAGLEVILWDTSNGKERRRLKGPTSPVQSVAFSPDGKLLAAGDTNQGHQTTLLVWEVDSGKETAYIAGAHQSCTTALAFAPDGKTLVSCSPYETRLWELATRKRPVEIKQGGSSLAFSPDGKWLTIAEHAGLGCIRIVDAGTGKEVRTLPGQIASNNAVAFAPDGKLLASGGGEGTVHLWDAASGREILRGPGHAAEVRAAVLAPDGARVVTASGGDHTLRIWNSADGAPLCRIDIPCANHQWLCPLNHAAFVAFAPDGKTILCDDKVFDAATGNRISELPGQALAMSADGKLLAGPRDGRRAVDDFQLAVWERTTRREVSHFTPFDLPRLELSHFMAAAFSSDGRVLAVGVANQHVKLREPLPESIFLYDVATGKLLHKFRPDRLGPGFLSFSPDGALLVVSGRWNEPIQLRRTADGREVRKLAGHEEDRTWIERRPVVFSPDGKLVAAAGKNNSIILWETITGQEVHRLTGHRGVVRSLAFAPDGRTLLSASADTTALLWSLAPPRAEKDLTAEDAKRLWDQLAGDDAAAAYRAAWTLARQPEDSLPILRKHLRPFSPPDSRQIARLLVDLDADEFAVRQAALDKLKKLRSTAEPALRAALANKPSLEVRKRIEELLAELRQHPIPAEELRQMRCVQALEWMKAPAAAELLRRLAEGDSELRTTLDARAALKRKTWR